MDKLNRDELTALLARVRMHDDCAFELLVAHYTPLIISCIRRLSLPVSEYEAEARIGLYNAALSYNVEQEGVTFGLYAKICITRLLYDSVRTRDAWDIPLSDEDVDCIAVSSGIVERILREEEREGFLSEARGLLSQLEYKVLVLWMKGYKTREISSILDTSAKSVNNAKSRITKKLRDGMPSRRE